MDSAGAQRDGAADIESPDLAADRGFGHRRRDGDAIDDDRVGGEVRADRERGVSATC